MVGFADLFTLPTRESIKATIVSTAEAAELFVTSWILGEPSERWVEISARLIDQFLSNPTTQAIRGFFFEYSTDPGDAGDLSADQTPRPGFLSAFGSGWWGVQRGGATYAAGFLTVTNVGSTPATFGPFDLTAQRSTAGADGGKPTYRNTEDGAVYTGLGGTLTLSPGASATIPIICEQIGSYGNATPTQINTMVTQSFGTLTCSNASPVLGDDREERESYIARCRQQSAAASPAGPADAFRYAATTGADGEPLQLYDGSGATSVQRVYVSADSSTGHVTMYLANAAGPATAAEVSSANGNIHGIEIPDPITGIVHNDDPIGVLPDTVTIGPTVADVQTGAPGPAAAIAVNIGPIKGTLRIKAERGKTALALVADIQGAILHALTNYFPTIPIGGVDQIAGAGVVYTSDLEGVIRDAYPVPAAGQAPAPTLYAVVVTTPASSATALAIGRVAKLVGAPAVTAVSNNGGAFRLTVSSAAGISTGNTIQIYASTWTLSGPSPLLGIWTVTVTGSFLDLNGSTYTASTYTETAFSLLIVTVT